ncbi:hypothetical protein BX666DRAFT_478696 [Dichotomocladium elegans]|nr:hypothetical protein BX666DRAFT_478696 [Dichotomocladium elegans]
MTFWKAKTKNECTGEIRFTPSHEYAEYVMQRIIAATLLLDKMQAVLMTMFIDQTATLNRGHFPGLMLVCMGIASRLYKIAHGWATDLQKCYEYIQAWHTNFPFVIPEHEREKLRKAYGFEMTCHPDTCNNARRESMHSWSGHSEVPGILSPLLETMVKTSLAEAAKSASADASLLDDDIGEVIARPLE